MEQEKIIKRMQVREQKRKLLEQKLKNVEAQKRKLEEMQSKMKREMRSIDNKQENDHSYYLLTCLTAINLDPLKDRAIILGSLAILAEDIQSGNASDEIDRAIAKYKDLVSKGIVNEASFEETAAPDSKEEETDDEEE